MADIQHSRLLQIDTGILSKDACIVIVRTEWNAAIIDELENGCKTVLASNGISDIRVIEVPGSFEIPYAIQKYWKTHKDKPDSPDAFIALGCVLRGDTPHFEYVCQGVTSGIAQLNIDLPVPVIFGVLTINTELQAYERLGGIHGHKGEEAAITAIKMIALSRRFEENAG